MVIHSVFFWLKTGLSARERAHFRSEVGKLGSIKTIEKIYIGVPASLAERSVTERSFDVALTIVFRDGAAHDAYQVDPVHLAFVEDNRASWTRVQVFDSEE
jgi:Stress responsive A/B Barrel Domain